MTDIKDKTSKYKQETYNYIPISSKVIIVKMSISTKALLYEYTNSRNCSVMLSIDGLITRYPEYMTQDRYKQTINATCRFSHRISWHVNAFLGSSSWKALSVSQTYLYATYVYRYVKLACRVLFQFKIPFQFVRYEPVFFFARSRTDSSFCLFRP